MNRRHLIKAGFASVTAGLAGATGIVHAHDEVDPFLVIVW